MFFPLQIPMDHAARVCKGDASAALSRISTFSACDFVEMALFKAFLARASSRRKGRRPSFLPRSYIGTMFGWSRSPVTTASARKFCCRSRFLEMPRLEHLHRDGPIRSKLARRIDDAHTAFTEQIQKFVVGKSGRRFRVRRKRLDGISHGPRNDDQRLIAARARDFLPFDRDVRRRSVFDLASPGYG